MDKKAEYECGCHSVHSRCLIRSAHNSMRNNGNFKCDTCMTVLFGAEYNNDYIEPDEVAMRANLEVLKTTKPFKDGLKKIKMYNTNNNKTLAAFKKKLGEEYTKFNNLININIMSIKLAKNEALKAIRQSEEYRKAINASSSVARAVNNFKRVFNLGWREGNILKLRAHGWRYYRSRPSALLTRKFRLRI